MQNSRELVYFFRKVFIYSVKKGSVHFICLCATLLLIFGSRITAKIILADTISDLQAKISARNADIANLEKEIANYQKDIDALNSQANTLSATIKSLTLTQKKLNADILVTENKILNKTYEIQELGNQIDDKESTIYDDEKIVAHTYALINELQAQSLPELILSRDSLASALDSMDNISTIQSNIVNKIKEIRQTKADLESTKSKSEKAKADLVKLNNQLKDQRQVVVNTQGEQKAILASTKASEAEYQRSLSQKKALKDQLEMEMLDFESQLKQAVDMSKLPHTGSGVLSWPLDNIKITQYFGNTPFATANPQIYNGKGHTGVDFAASIGTPVKASLNGIIRAVGNTDIVSTCLSFGKWIMIEHPDGLSTLYAHLSVQSVSVGQNVTTGQVIGYSGNTGYTTGPHLHFGVYATQGLQITTLTNSRNCRNVLMPLANLKAYLNPLSYL